MRPQRQARSSVSYKDNLSDDDDFSMPVGRSSRKPTSHKKNAAVEEEQRARSSAPKRKERPNPKERAEAMQLERAIKESLNDADRQGTKVSELSSSPRPPFRALHLDEYRSNIHRPSIAFQCLLDVASEEDGSAAQDETVLTGALESHSQQEKDEPQVSSGSLTTSDPMYANEAPEQSKPTENAANLEKGFHQEVQEKYYQDTSRHKKVRKSSGSVDTEDQNEEDSSSAEAKASRKARRLATEDSSPTAGAMSRNRVLEGNLATSEEHKPVSEENNQRIWLAQHSPSNGVENEARKPGMSPPATESSGLLLSVQSSSLPHRRVVGLSRRFRPPPLHPYLLG